MSTELESALQRTLAHAAERAPKAPPAIAAMRRRRFIPRPRNAGVQVALAAAAVLAVGGGAVIISQALPTHGNNAASAPGGTAVPPVPGTPPPAEQVWPNAVHRVSNTLQDGRTFGIADVLDDRTMLITTQSSFEKTDALYSYDLRTRAAKEIAKIATPPDADIFASDFTAAGGNIAWWSTTKKATEIWSVPVSGGTPHRVASQPGGQSVSRLAIDGKNAVWSLRKGGVYQAPLTGGTPRMVAGSEGMHILVWPWIGRPNGFEMVTPTEARKRVGEPNTGTPDDFVAAIGDRTTLYKDVRNVRTGETRTSSVSDNGSFACGVVWCVGNKGGIVVERRDASGRVTGKNISSLMRSTPNLNRFVVVQSGTDLGVYDLKTGKVGTLDRKDKQSFRMPLDPAKRFYYTHVKDGLLIVDMGAIA